MPHQFDTGLALAQRTTIRRAVIAKLAPMLKSQGLYARAIKAIPRVLQGEGDEFGLSLLAKAIQGQQPAIAVALGRKVYETAALDPKETRADLELQVYVASGNQRDELSGRLEIDAVGLADVTADPGVEVMLEHVEQLLLGQSLDIDGVSEIIAVDEDHVLTADDASVWMQSYLLKVERQITPSLRVPILVTEIEGQHNTDGTVETDLDPLVTTISPLEPPDPED